MIDTRNSVPSARRPLPISVLVVAVEAAQRRAVCAFVASQSELRLVGEASSELTAFMALARDQVDLVLAVASDDWELPGGIGGEFVRRVKALPTNPCLVVVAAEDTSMARLSADEAGADGFTALSGLGPDLMASLAKLTFQD